MKMKRELGQSPNKLKGVFSTALDDEFDLLIHPNTMDDRM